MTLQATSHRTTLRRPTSQLLLATPKGKLLAWPRIAPPSGNSRKLPDRLTRLTFGQRTAKADIDVGKSRYQTMRALIEETKKR